MSGGRAGRPRLLAVIASYGLKNLELLRRVIAEYKGMNMDVDVVVVSNEPKELDADVRVVVGLPSRDPWSLPFAHKAIFAKNVDRYDLFAYSEDDMEVREANIRAFLRATPHLALNEIAGFLRYEVDECGGMFFPEVHGSYYWKPESVHRRGEYTIAEFTNEHAAFYLMTQAQLKTAIASGGFVRGPYAGRYDMLCTAATDPYTRCGFRKVVCVSALEDFLIHHLSNRYAGKLGVSRRIFREQIEALMAIGKGTYPASSLLAGDHVSSGGECSKSYYEEPDEELLALVPRDAKRIVSVGCGWGASEARLKERGAYVTAAPMDSIIGAAAAREGIDVVHGTLEECLAKWDGQRFDCILMTNVLHLVPNPRQVVEACARLVRVGDCLWSAVPTSVPCEGGENAFLVGGVLASFAFSAKEVLTL